MALTEEQFLNEVLLGRSDAVLFCLLLGEISQTWDDLIDQDKPVGKERIHAAFMATLLRLPVMPFYIDNFQSLYPIIQISIYDWMTANELEQGNEHSKTLAFVLRDSLTAVVVQCAYLVGGHEHAIKQAPIIRARFHDEKLSAYLNGLENRL